ncbi:MAG: hypothetical protein AB8B96_11785 [Lysobacterales bacterium]
MSLFRDLLLSLFIATLSFAANADPITPHPWSEVVVSVTNLDRSAEFFTQIGGYEEKHRGAMEKTELASFGLVEPVSAESLLLGPAGHERGLIRLVRFDNAGPRRPMRPGSRTWDTGCFFSLMIRMKDMQRVFDDAIALGWWTETPITDLTFGPSKLKVVIYRGPDGVQVQGYERLQPPLPAAIGPFDRFTRPFNLMQMVRDRDASHQFFTTILGFQTYYKGTPYVSPSMQPTPLGIPLNLTTSVRYRASIVYPVPGEFGRMEMIEMMDLDGNDFADQCVAPSLGILAVRFEVRDAESAAMRVKDRGWPIERSVQSATIAPLDALNLFSVKTPDGAIMQFFSVH